MDDSKRVLYQPFSSILNPGFWQQLINVKLNVGLSKDPIPATGSYSCNLAGTLPCLAHFDQNSLDEEAKASGQYTFSLHGRMLCTNIEQEFLDCDRKDFLQQNGNAIWKSIYNGQALQNPSLYLSRFGLLVYGDLKKYNFLYWFSFPALNYPRDVHYCIDEYSDCPTGQPANPFRPISDFMDESALSNFQDQFNLITQEKRFQLAYFIVKHHIDSKSNQSHVKLFALSDHTQAFKNEETELNPIVYFAYADPSASQDYPGWPLRNYLCLIATQFKLNRVRLIRLRHGQPSSKSKIGIHHSSVFEVEYNLDEAYSSAEIGQTAIPDAPVVTGWEKSAAQKLMPRQVNLSKMLDPKELANDAVNLNLRLMKWRIVPNLNLDLISSTKCLLLGCGTLGCHIARGLLAWGITNLTLVDSSKISYSNPVRQSLYSFEDCSSEANSNSFKADVAAATLKRIHPSINVQSHVMTIPMPGHHTSDQELRKTCGDVAKLEELIEAHDAIFLLMDTRESRWLPTVIAISKQKLVINAAIGFDTFLLQRYGLRDLSMGEPSVPIAFKSIKQQASGTQNLPSDQLGCYFCNDIVAPGDSTQDRTLDQQCTVSRPGVSMMVSALAVELLASVISSRLGLKTPAPIITDPDTHYDEELGIVPHSIRGNLSTYHLYMPTTPCFNKCCACSLPVLNAYKVRGVEFLKEVFRDPSHLEEITGLKDLLQENNQILQDVLVLDSDDDDDQSCTTP